MKRRAARRAADCESTQYGIGRYLRYPNPVAGYPVGEATPGATSAADNNHVVVVVVVVVVINAGGAHHIGTQNSEPPVGHAGVLS